MIPIIGFVCISTLTIVHSLPNIMFGHSLSQCLQEVLGSQLDNEIHFRQAFVHLAQHPSQMEDAVLETLSKSQMSVTVIRPGKLNLKTTEPQRIMLEKMNLYITVCNNAMDILPFIGVWKSDSSKWNALADVMVLLNGQSSLHDLDQVFVDSGMQRVCFIITEQSMIHIVNFTGTPSSKTHFVVNCSNSTRTKIPCRINENYKTTLEKTLRVSVMQWQPFTNIDENTFSGIEVDLVRTIGKHLNLDLMIAANDFDRDNQTQIIEHLHNS